MSQSARDDAQFFETIRSSLNTALVGDILDTLGYTRQFLPPTIRPLDPKARLVGRAMPVKEAEFVSGRSDYKEHGKGPLGSLPFGLMMQALDDLRENEIYIASSTSLGTPPPFAFWGGLMSTRAQYLKAAGAIVNGFARDVDEIAHLGFPVWSVGMYSQDQGPRGKVIDWRCSIEIGGVSVNPGDLIFADKEGVLIIPHAVEEECIRLAIEKHQAENAFSVAVKQGMSVQDAFKKFGVM